MTPGERIKSDAVAAGDPRHKRLVAMLVHPREVAVILKRRRIVAFALSIERTRGQNPAVPNCGDNARARKRYNRLNGHAFEGENDGSGALRPGLENAAAGAGRYLCRPGPW